MFEYGSRAGFWRLWRLFTARRLPVTVFGVAPRSPAIRKSSTAMREAGWDIACHGLKWIDYRDFSYQEEGAAYARGHPHPHRGDRRAPPFGWYTGRTSEHTLKLVLEDGGLLYSSDSYPDDLPYWVKCRRART